MYACKLLILKRETGIEPATSSLGSWHSTAELLPLNCWILQFIYISSQSLVITVNQTTRP